MTIFEKTRTGSQARNRRRVSSRKRHAVLYAQLLSEIFEHIDEVDLGSKLFVYVRSSDDKQEKRGSDKDQADFVCSFINVSGCHVVGNPFIRIETGKRCLEHERSLRWAVQRARKLGADAIGAESVCRFIRHRDFNFTDNGDLVSTFAELKWLREVTDGVRLVTMLPPNASPAQIIKHQQWRGHEYGDKGGRRRKQNKSDWVSKFEQIGSQIDELLGDGISHLLIGQELNLPKSTVTKYINRMDTNEKNGLDRYAWNPIRKG